MHFAVYSGRLTVGHVISQFAASMNSLNQSQLLLYSTLSLPPQDTDLSLLVISRDSWTTSHLAGNGMPGIYSQQLGR